jgi:hypothetical protein
LNTSKLTKILEILGDSEWHTLVEIRERSEIDKKEMKPIVDFLKDYDIVIDDKQKRKIRLREMAQKLLAEKASP